MNKHLFLITGASRGLGLALAHAVDREDSALFLVSRSEIKDRFNDSESVLLDLSDPDSAGALLNSFESFAAQREIASITLINNAGTVEPVKPAHQCQAGDIISGIHLNLMAPMLLASDFMARFQSFDVSKRIINISSGAASSAYAGWSVYCAGKSGIEHFTRCVGLEQALLRFPTKMIALAPGVIDTHMQDVVRASSEKDFPMIDRFLELKSKSKLFKPEQAAGYIADFLEQQQLEHGGIYDIRDYLQ